MDSSSSEDEEGPEPENEVPLLTKYSHHDDEEAPSHGYRPCFRYNLGHRPRRDVGFARAFISLTSLIIAVGIFAIVNRNPNYWKGPTKNDPGGSCSTREGIDPAGVIPTWLVEDDGLWTAVAAIVVATVPVACILFFWLVRSFTAEVVAVAPVWYLFLWPGFPLALNWSCYRKDTCRDALNPNMYINSGILVLTIPLTVFFYCRRARQPQTELAIRIIRTACEAVRQNLGLALLVPALGLVYSAFLAAAAVFVVFARANGGWVILDLNQRPRPCVWSADVWVPTYENATGFALLWAAMVVKELHVFASSGTVSQWYFAAAESSSSSSSSSNARTIARALRHALGPSFGTLCLSALVLVFVRAVQRAVAASGSGGRRRGCASLAVRACLECLISAVGKLTGLTVNFAAITGEGFRASGAMTFHLLKRNSLPTAAVWSLAFGLVMQAALVFALVYGLLVWGVLGLFLRELVSPWHAVVPALVLSIALTWGGQLLVNVIDTVYVCYAIDKDNMEVSRAEYHEVYVLLPPVDDGTASLAVPRSPTRGA